MLMARFYRQWHIDGHTPAMALQKAQLWMRDTTNDEKLQYFQQLDPALTDKMPDSTVRTFYKAVRTFCQELGWRDDLDVRDFAHPVWWAAFYLTGV